jgi:hypothetical protein
MIVVAADEMLSSFEVGKFNFGETAKNILEPYHE